LVEISHHYENNSFPREGGLTKKNRGFTSIIQVDMPHQKWKAFPHTTGARVDDSPYSPGIAPSDFDWFGKVKNELIGESGGPSLHCGTGFTSEYSDLNGLLRSMATTYRPPLSRILCSVPGLFAMATLQLYWTTILRNGRLLWLFRVAWLNRNCALGRIQCVSKWTRSISTPNCLLDHIARIFLHHFSTLG
jgi:hypothetical protein